MPKTDRKDKIERFVEEYLVDLNATQAYLRSHPGVTDGTARTESSKLLAKPDIQDAIALAKKKRSNRTRVTQDRIVRELELLAFSDLSKLASWGSDGVELMSSKLLKPSQRRVVSEVSSGQYGPKLKLHSKIRALEVLLEHVKATDGNGNDRPVSFADLIKKALEAKKKKGN
jgi:phage terminase small subunit